MQKDVVIALKHMQDTINDLVRRVDNMANDHYQENAGRISTLDDKSNEHNFKIDRLEDGHSENAEEITDLQEMIVDELYELTLDELDLDDPDSL